MLEFIDLKHTGPAAQMRLDLAPRLNLLTGDNGLGKTFLLDVVWWIQTKTWPGYPAAPQRGVGVEPTILWQSRTEGRREEHKGVFDFASQQWTTTEVTPPRPPHAPPPTRDVVLYARVDGGFSLWDPNRIGGKYRFPFDEEAFGLSSSFHFSAEQVWDGLQAEDRDRTILCNGLIRDWATWQLQNNGTFATLTEVLEGLSPDPKEVIRPGASTARVSVHDVRDIPTLEFSYGTVPVVYASAGMKRILSLAYLLVWALREHVEAAKLKNTEPSKGFVLLLDEVEAHLHPKWQRHILPALLRVIERLLPQFSVQIVTSTHAPLVLASLETHFDEHRDALFELQPDASGVSITRAAWRRRGDASMWLVSDVFHLPSARSVEAEQAIEEASKAMADPGFDAEKARAIDAALRSVLGDTDPFWTRWSYVAEKQGWLP